MGGTRHACGPVRMPEVERVVITVITGNYHDALRPDVRVAKRFRARPGKWMHAEHGLSYFVETVSHGGDRRFFEGDA